jgi:hypothetical protein
MGVPGTNYASQHADVWGNGDISPRICNLGTRRKLYG